MQSTNYVKISSFFNKRIVEIIGLLTVLLSFFLLLSLSTYTLEDPNFIFPDNTEIKNILGPKGSFVSDLFFQSIGLISILTSITLFITGNNIIRTKKLLLMLQNSFYLILYSILGSLFFTVYYPESFWLAINGNGGFVGKLLSESFLISIINLNKEIFYYLLGTIILIVFFLSINFNIFWFLNLIKKTIFKLFSKKEKIILWKY